MCCYVFSMRECLFPNEVQSKYMNSWAKTTSRYIAHRRFVLVVKWWCYCNIISFTNECMWKGAAWRFAKNSMCRRSHALAAHTSVLTLDHCKYRPHQQQQQGKKQQSTCVQEKAVDIFIVCMLCHALLWAIGSPLLSCSLLLLCGEKFHNILLVCMHRSTLMGCLKHPHHTQTYEQQNTWNEMEILFARGFVSPHW